MLKIQVTKNDIKQGKKHYGDSCPVAIATTRAIKRTYKSFNKHLLVTSDGLYFNWQLAFKMPKKVSEFVIKFDTGCEVKPFSYCLPEKYLKGE